MTQDDYKLWTGASVTFSNADWTRIVAVASKRLASFLCLESLPAVLPDDLEELLANFINAVFKYQGDYDAIESKSVRNFTIHFRSDSAVNAFAQVAKNYGDTIDEYSECGTTIKVEHNTRNCCGNWSCDECI